MDRRTALKNTALGLGAIALGSTNCTATEKSAAQELGKRAKGESPVRHSVSRWCYGEIALEELADVCVDLGIESIELTTPAEWPVLKDRGLTCAMATFPWVSLTEGFNNPKNHSDLQVKYTEAIKQTADAGIPNLICFSGNIWSNLSDNQGLIFCAQGLRPLAKLAEEAGVTIQMELFNTTNHPGYQAVSTEWGVALTEMIGSPNFKLLYDIYHMQIMEGDIIATIRKYSDYLGHYHTAGVPGRNEIDETQELYYPAIIRAIYNTGYNGFIGQEFIPSNEDKLASLAEAIQICTV